MELPLMKKIAVLFTGLLVHSGCAGSYKHVGLEIGTKSGGSVTVKICSPECDTPMNTLPATVKSSVDYLTGPPAVTFEQQLQPVDIRPSNQVLTVPSNKKLPQSQPPYAMQTQYSLGKPRL